MIEHTILDDPEQIAFQVFADAYPHEAYAKDPERFCAHVRSKGTNISDDEIRKALADTER